MLYDVGEILGSIIAGTLSLFGISSCRRVHNRLHGQTFAYYNGHDSNCQLHAFGAFSSKLTHVNRGMLYLWRGASEWAVAVLLLVTGVFMGGSANLITGCISGMNAASCVRFTDRCHSGPWPPPVA
jgi:hypothetical protein